MPLTGTVDVANARIDLFIDWTATAGTQTSGTLHRRVGGPDADNEYVRGHFGSSLLGEQAYVSDHEAPLDEQIWYVAVNNQTSDTMVAGPFTIPSNGYVWMKDPGRPWADLRLDLCLTPSVADPCPVPALLTDTFTRTTAASWGSTEPPGAVLAWTTAGGAAADYSVSGGQGRHLIPPGGVVRHTSVAQPQADVDIVADVGINELALTNSIGACLIARMVDVNNLYMTRLEFLPSGLMVFSLRRIVAGVQTQIAGWSTQLPYTAGGMFTVRMQVEGNSLRARVWPATTAEPDDWAVVAVDSSFAAAGSVGMRSFSTGTNAGPFALYDNLSVSALPAPSAIGDDLAWVGYRDKVRAMDAGLFPVLDRERPADVYARRKDIVTSCLFLSRSLDAINRVYELYTAGGPLLFQTPEIYGMDKPYGQQDRYFQPGDLNEGYISQDQRKPVRLWSAPLTAVDLPVGLPQGTDDANWCAVKDKYPTYADLTATGLTWGQIAAGGAA
ncbi:MAG TPA: hypothetical protein VFX97_20635 [Pyrinomonadaceae bacterium]|nr:hypothetical protein [Pyrinomonadaceae bacterium]